MNLLVLRSRNLSKTKHLFLNSKTKTINLKSYSSSLEWPTDKVRRSFVDFFCDKNDHKFIKSSSVLPRKSSGTYFTNAGMNQFKSIILGEEDARNVIDFNRYIGSANYQKCIRIGGKHSDLDEIGKDTYHHTFFEMLGNWSFGAYENEKACQLALDLLVNVYKLNMNGLYFTYFGGNKSLGLEPDLKTRDIWLKLGVPSDHLLPFDMKDNFWEMDVVGPCGPCTEIHYDRMVTRTNDPAKLKEARDLVNKGTERVIELWNLVFMKYNRLNPKTFLQLPNQVVDTGMGLERVTTVLNNLDSNYDIDVFHPIFEHIHLNSKHNNIPHYRDCNVNTNLSSAYRTLSDHMRSIVISISDGLMPSRNGLGGFLKYLILKCMKISREDFLIKDETRFLCEMVPIICGTLQNAYPELIIKSNFIQEVIRSTEIRQNQKLNLSNLIIDRYLKKLNNPSSLTAEQVWKLFKGDGYGEEIPIEFIKEKLVDEKKLSLDLDGFDKILLSDNEKSLKNIKHTRKDNSAYIGLTNKLKDVPKTDDSYKYSFKLDTEKREAFFDNQSNFKSKILSVFVKKPSDKSFDLADSLKLNDECLLVLDKTSFYPESGGQISDHGYIKTNDAVIEIDKVISVRGYSFHSGKVVEITNDKSKVLNEACECIIDNRTRFNVTLNHTGVHLLNHAIRKYFKDEDSITQVNSIVKNNSFKLEIRFNKSLKKPTLNDINEIEKICKDLIAKSLDVYITENQEISENRQLRYPLRRLDDILYPMRVRVVSVGEKWNNFINNDSKQYNYDYTTDYSAELCCGTHASNTKQLKNMIIRHFIVNGDSTLEIDCTTSDLADLAEKNDKISIEFLKNMKELFDKKTIEEKI